ncbi:MAG: tetratricopeptide repeat protein [Vicingaceae bacterium]|nr:tetratricopeptide repeat protein [Vicingaceae bacterium]
MKNILFILTFFFAINNFAQTNVDSLWAIWNNKSIEDTSRYTALNSLISDYYISENPDTAMVLSELMLKETQSKSTYHAIYAYNNLAISSFSIVSPKQLTEILQNFESFAHKIKSDELRAKAYYFLALRYLKFGDYPKSSEHFYESLKLFETLKDTASMARSSQNIGQLYYYQKDYATALDFYTKSQKMFETINETRGVAMSHNNIGRLLKKQGKIDEAIASFEKSKLLLESINDNKSIVQVLGNMSLIYKRLSDYDKALSMTDEIITYAEKSKDNRTLITALGNKASMNNKLNNTTIALKSAQKAYELAEIANLPKKSMETSAILFGIYKKQGNYRKALEFYENYIAIKEELLNEENKRGLIRKEYEFEYDKKMLADSIKDAETKKVLDAQIATQKAELKHEKTQKIALYSGLIILALFGGFAYNRFRVTNKQKIIIEEQKEAVEIAHEELGEKNKEIMDSISYAKRIQTAILPPNKLVKEYLKDSFILYKPKDIVAGDFYWMETIGKKTLFAAADCTGHGVPGAMVSVICNNGLNRSVREFGLIEPGKILDKTREIVIQEFEKSEEEVKDGMDIALCCLEGNKLQYAGAHNPLWIIRKDAEEVEEIKANKQPIGQFDNPEPYTTHSIELKQGDSIYVFSDGYADQFGGEKGKKLKTANFKRLLLSIQKENIDKQKELINTAFEDWKGNLEQLDDVCVIGVRI